MDYIGRHTTFNFIREEFHPTNLPQFDLNFHFSFKSQDKLFIINQDQTISSVCIPSITALAAAVATGASPTRERAAEAVGKTVGCFLLNGEREDLIEVVCKELSRNFGAETLAKKKQGILHLFFEARVENRHVYVVEDDEGGPGMVPAGEAAFAVLEEMPTE